jgi:hypothetical protein
MLLCKDCNYYKSFNNPAEKQANDKLSNQKIGTCNYAGYIFLDDPDNLENEYPCNQTSTVTSR